MCKEFANCEKLYKCKLLLLWGEGWQQFNCAEQISLAFKMR